MGWKHLLTGWSNDVIFEIWVFPKEIQPEGILFGDGQDILNIFGVFLFLKIFWQ